MLGFSPGGADRRHHPDAHQPPGRPARFYFTEGNAPLGFLTAPEGWGRRSQIRELQLWLNAQLAGQPAERAKLILDAGRRANYQALKDPPLKDDFDEWLARIVAFAFSLPPTPFVRQMNRATAGEDQDRSQEEGLAPLKLWVKRLVDEVNEAEFGETDLEFAWIDTPEVDPAPPSRTSTTRPCATARPPSTKSAPAAARLRSPAAIRPASMARRRRAPRR